MKNRQHQSAQSKSAPEQNDANSNNFDFDVWAREVKRQMIESLQKNR